MIDQRHGHGGFRTSNDFWWAVRERDAQSLRACRDAKVGLVVTAARQNRSLAAALLRGRELQPNFEPVSHKASYRPNGSRLSCGRNARWRKAVRPQIKRLAGESTQFFPTGERPPASS